MLLEGLALHRQISATDLDDNLYIDLVQILLDNRFGQFQT
jgi:hypothetical protein